MDKFVCVRMVQANGADLRLFQFDYDLTFTAFFMNADKAIYGRFGSRASMKESTRDISLEGFGKAMEAALELHKQYPANKEALFKKKGPPPPFAVPEEYPSLKGKYTAKLNYESKVAQSCIHCHMVRDADRTFIRSSGKLFTDREIFPWPMPDLLGFRLDPKERARLQIVSPKSAAERAGLKRGDVVLEAAGQPIVSLADLQYVLEYAPEDQRVPLLVSRGKKQIKVELVVPKGWRKNMDISGRPTTWDFRRMVTGGMLLEEISPSEKKKRSIAEENLALGVSYMGEYGAHAAAKKAGFKKDDILIEVDGSRERVTESGLMGFLLQKHLPGETISVRVLRIDKEIALTLPMQ